MQGRSLVGLQRGTTPDQSSRPEGSPPANEAPVGSESTKAEGHHGMIGDLRRAFVENMRSVELSIR